MTTVEFSAARRNHWQALDASHRERTRKQAPYWLLAVAAHLAIAAVFLVNLARPDQPPRDDVAIEVVTPPAPPAVEPPPKSVEVQELPKPHTIVPHVVPKPIPKLVQTPPLPTIVPPMPVIPHETPLPPAAPAQAAPPPTYLSALYAHLAANKHYPRAAQQAHVEGTALLRFKMNRQGRVLSFSLERSSGHEVLDSEVLAMIQRAQPLPSPPADMPDPMELIIPVQFTVH